MADDPDPNPANVGRQTRRGLSWSLLGALVTNAMRVVVIVVLGRSLTSEDFGVVAAAISVNVVLYGIRDVGLGPALVQRRAIERGHLATVFALSTYLGFGLCVGLIVAAGPIAALLGMPSAVDVIGAMAVLFALRGVSTASRMMCQRAMNFRAIALVESGAFTLGSVVAMLLAVLGAGPWALVAGYLVEELIQTCAFLWLQPPPVTLRMERARLRELWQFGAGQTVSQLAGTAATYGDNFVVGGALGASALGFYTRAYDLIKLPSMVFASVVGNVLFPAFARLQDEPARLAAHFRRLLFLNALVLLPASAVLVVVAPEALRVLVGPGWDDAVLPFRILAVTILFRTSQKLGAIVAQAAGRMNAIAVAYIVYAVLVIGGASLTVRWGIAGVATSTAVAIAVVCAESCYIAMRVCQTRVGVLLRAHLPGVVLAGVAIGVTWPTAVWMREQGLAAWSIFATTTAAAVLACLAVGLVWLRRGAGDFGWLRQELTGLLQRRRRPAAL